MEYQSEFATVNILLKSEFETRGVDSFVISLIKVERQIRRIFTFLIFQHPNYKSGDGARLREIPANNKHIYLRTFIIGINLIYRKSVQQVYGVDYEKHFDAINEITKDMNKIFHGQLTNKNLSRVELIDRVELMKKWCKTMADSFSLEIGYDGFDRNAYHKSGNGLKLMNTDKFDTFAKYRRFLGDLAKQSMV